MNTPIISIVICTHRRFDLLEGAIESLVNQTASSHIFQVIVVDNDQCSNPEVKEIVEKVKRKITIQYIHEPKLGLSHARNTGGQNARADYIGYMDDDAKAPVDYIKNIEKLIRRHQPDIFGGPYFPFYLDPKPEWFQDSYGTGTKGDDVRFLSENEYLDGGNIGFNRSILELTGWFDPALGMTGKKVWYGEETMVIIRARELKKDLKVYYEPEIYVEHLVPVWKMSVVNQLKKRFQQGRSQVYFWILEKDQKKARSQSPGKFLRILFSILLKTVPQLILRNRSRYPFSQNFLFEEVSKSFNSLGGQSTLIIDLLYNRINKIKY